MDPEDYRDPSLAEKKLIDLLAAADYQGSAEIRQQLASCHVRIIDDDGSLSLKISSPVFAAVRYRVPVELYGKDMDGVDIHVLLHVVQGICTEIEIYKDTPDRIKIMPETWSYFIPGS
ncbi:hypothetical protein CupriaWKF_27930 [Cupriavidus sp. WKF15]|uniref:DUF6984 family protein n=1 Tax=Cupriavidus sp. WKF15 TaxID=3032282 RepID=UPI0023E116B1|nr:hypothetical protein [Cupriavidus sp. WKF15]WER48603.1 hypothetical protein CupriaWKF_27930 [Cupriavidus sp. WKF15]